MKGRVYSSRVNLIKSQHRLPKTFVGLQSNRPTAIQPIRSATNLTQLAGLPPDPSTIPRTSSPTIATKTHHFIQYKNIVQCIYIYCSGLLLHFPPINGSPHFTGSAIPQPVVKGTTLYIYHCNTSTRRRSSIDS